MKGELICILAKPHRRGGQFIYNIPDISPQQIEKMIEFFQSRDNIKSICEDYDILSESAGADQNLNKFCQKIGISSSRLKTDIDNTGSKIANTIKTEGLNSKTKKTIADEFDSLTDKIKNYIKYGTADEKLIAELYDDIENSKSEKIAQAISLTVMNFVVNTICHRILKILLGPVGDALTSVVVAPFVEEVSKQVALKGGYSKEYTIIFNVFEFTNYVTAYKNIVPISVIVPVRLICIGLHLADTFVQWVTSDPKIMQKIGIESEEDKKNLKLVGFLTAFVMHSTWNAGFGTVIMKLIFK